MALGKRIIEARGKMSRTELARRSGVPYPTLAGLENSDQKRSTHSAAIAAALGVHALWLETGKGPKWLNDSATGTPTNSEVIPVPVSQPATPDPDILHEALTLLLFDIDHGGPRSARSATRLVLQLYSRIQAAGGRLPDDEQEAFEAAARARGQGKKNDRSVESGGGKRRKRN